MSAHWAMSSKERLGLGGRVGRDEKVKVLPWNAGTAAAAAMAVADGAAAVNRLGVMSETSQEYGKLKRLRLKFGLR